MKMIKPISYIELSDIHLGHRRVTPEIMVYQLIAFFNTNMAIVSVCDYIFIAGDLWDRLLEWPSTEVTECTVFTNYLVALCKKFNIKLRVLEGTPSHDWRQSTHLMAAKRLIDVRYYGKLTIDVEDDGLTVLYIPDEWSHCSSDTFDDVKTLMVSKGLEKVDLVMMHGHFGFQIPEHLPKIPRHSEADYLSIVKYFVHCGHDHRFAVFPTGTTCSPAIISAGSTGRLAHNEEEPKGMVHCVLNTDGGTYTFLENTYATVFKTVTITQKSVEKTIAYLRKAIYGIPEESFVSLDIKDPNLSLQIRDIATAFPLITITVKSRKKATDGKYRAVEGSPVVPPERLTKDKLRAVLIERVLLKNPAISLMEVDGILTDLMGD